MEGVAEPDANDAPRARESPVNNRISGGTLGVSVQAGTILGDVHVHQPPGTRLGVPRQLPQIPTHFTNRQAEMRALDAAVAGRGREAPVVVLLSGPGGVGKTALASCWGSRISGDFPEGQLYADLGGFSVEGPASVRHVLGGFLRALGVAAEKVPPDLAEQTALFRTLTVRSRLLMLLDNAASAAQIRPLVPASAGSVVVVSSRWRLGGLLAAGAVLVEVEALSQRDAVELLKRSAEQARDGGARQHVDDLAELCGRLPLALCVAGARLASRPRWPVARVVRELADEQRRLAALSTRGDVSVVSVFDLSYEDLSPGQARAYRWLALHPGPDFSAAAAAAVVGLPLPDATEVLETLVDASVLQDSGIDRYRFHDLIRLHARRRAEAEDSTATRDAILRRVAEYYLSFAVAADRVVMPQEWHVAPAYRRPETGPAAYRTGVEALDALESELPNIMSILRKAGTVAELDDVAWQLCEAMWSLFLYRKHFPDWVAAYRLGAEAAHRSGDQLAGSRMHHRLGIALHNLSRPREALAEGRAALAAARAAGHDLAESSALQLMGMALRASGQFEEAIDVLRQAVTMDHRTGQSRSEALAQRLLGQALYAAGHNDQAVEELQRACELAAALSDPPVEAMSKVCLAEALTRGGRPSDALRLAHEAWEVMRHSGSDQYRARTLMVWGEAAEGAGDLRSARERLGRALAFFTDAGVPDLRPARQALSRVEARLAAEPPSPDTA
ncbi:tetratricopeptide repeat protein [Streptomyces mayteni]